MIFYFSLPVSYCSKDATLLHQQPLLSVIVTVPLIAVVVLDVSVIALPPFNDAELATGNTFVTLTELLAVAANTI